MVKVSFIRSSSKKNWKKRILWLRITYSISISLWEKHSFNYYLFLFGIIENKINLKSNRKSFNKNYGSNKPNLAWNHLNNGPEEFPKHPKKIYTTAFLSCETLIPFQNIHRKCWWMLVPIHNTKFFTVCI